MKEGSVVGGMVTVGVHGSCKKEDACCTVIS